MTITNNGDAAHDDDGGDKFASYSDEKDDVDNGDGDYDEDDDDKGDEK